MTATELTAFQKQCRETVDGMLRDLGRSSTYECLEGREEEAYLIGWIDDARMEVKVYIYEDESGFFLDRRWFGYETQDFPDSAQLINCFVRDLKEALTVAD